MEAEEEVVDQSGWISLKVRSVMMVMEKHGPNQ